MRPAELTALLIAPNRELADGFRQTLARTRAFQIVGDLKVYPTEQTLDIRLKQLRPEIILLDVATSLDTAIDLIRFITNQKPASHVVALHTGNESEAIMRTLRAGATEFLYAPFEISVQEAAITRILKLLAVDTPSDRTQGKVVVFSSAKPGSGASTLAAQTAFALSRTSKGKVLLADFDLTGGTLAFYLQIQQSYSLVDLMQHASRLDNTLWSKVTVESNGIDVLPAPEMPYAEPVEPARFHEVLQFSRNLYDWIIVDVPAIFHRISLLALSDSDRAFMIATSELASLHLARRAVKLLTHVGFDTTRYQVLINRLDKRDGINTSDLGKLFDCKVDATLPNDYFALNRVVALGQPLEQDTELGRAIDGLATKLRGAKPETRRGPGLFTARPLLSQT